MITSSNKHCHAAIRLADLDALREHIGVETTNLYVATFEERLREVLRSSDKLIPLDDGNYCLLFRNLTDRNLVELAVAKLKRVLEGPVEVINERLFFNFNAGFAVPTDAAASPRDLMRSAQAAMRRAISLDQPCYVAGDEAPATSEPDELMLPRVERALRQGEFTLYYQPKVSAAFGTVVGAEGLVRWHDAERETVVMPGEFVPLAERSGLIKPLTEYLLREAIARCATWAAPLSVAVNLPPVMLQHESLKSVVADALDVIELEPGRLTLEITERGALPAVALQRLEELRSVGVKVAIDDFGTGQSSLSYLRDLPADQIKIDRSFVSAMLESSKDQAIVRGCIDLAHHCGMEAVAEGVEDEDTAAQLAEMGCDVLQGYWFSEPLPAAEFEKRYLSGSLADAEADRFSALMSRR